MIFSNDFNFFGDIIAEDNNDVFNFDFTDQQYYSPVATQQQQQQQEQQVTLRNSLNFNNDNAFDEQFYFEPTTPTTTTTTTIINDETTTFIDALKASPTTSLSFDCTAPTTVKLEEQQQQQTQEQLEQLQREQQQQATINAFLVQVKPLLGKRLAETRFGLCFVF